MTYWTPAYAFTKRFWAGCIVLLLSAMFATVTLLSANDARRLASTNVLATATVLENRNVTSNAANDGAETHYVTYTFTLGDVSITNERGVPEDFFDTHPVGTAWNIKVHPDRPRIHDLYAG